MGLMQRQAPLPNMQFSLMKELRPALRPDSEVHCSHLSTRPALYWGYRCQAAARRRWDLKQMPGIDKVQRQRPRPSTEITLNATTTR
jgi:hypothetical protein